MLLRETLTRLAVPWHDAPLDAEAECANMEAQELVDAVWSEGTEAFAYGCRTLVKSYRPITLSNAKEVEPKSHTHFKVYTLEDIERQQAGMNRHGFVINAMLCKAGEVVKDGPRIESWEVLQAIGHGLTELGSSLAKASSEALFKAWLGSELKPYLKGTDCQLDTRLYPTYEQFRGYIAPPVSTREALGSIGEPADPFLSESELASFFDQSFKWNIKKWAQWILPLRIVRALIATEEDHDPKHDHWKLACDFKKKNNKNAKNLEATFVLRNATKIKLPPANEIGETCKLNTMLWILQKSRLNGNTAMPVHGFSATPVAGRTYNGSSRPSTQGKQVQRSSADLFNPASKSTALPAHNITSSSTVPASSARPTTAKKRSKISSKKGSKSRDPVTSPSGVQPSTILDRAATPPASSMFVREEGNRTRPSAMGPPIPNFLPTPISHGKDDEQNERESTPPSPSVRAANRRRDIHSRLGATTSKNLSQTDKGSSSRPVVYGGSNAVRTSQSQKEHEESRKRRRSDSPSISEDISNKRARPEFVDLTLVSENHDLTLVDSQSDYGSEPASQDLVNLHLSISPTNNVITIDDSDSETEYGTPPPPEALLLVP